MATGELPWSAESERGIVRLLTRYCLLLDEGDMYAMVPAIFAPGAVADYQGMIKTGREEITEYLVTYVPGYRLTSHLLSNVWIKSCDDQRAEVSSMLSALHWWDQEDVNAGRLTNFMQIVRNDDAVELTSEGWRITKRRTSPVGTLSELKDAALPPALLKSTAEKS